MTKRLIAVLLSVLLILGLAACSNGGTTTNPDPQKETQSQQGGSQQTDKTPGDTVRGLNLKDYTNMDCKFTMLCPDLHKYSTAGTDCWYYTTEAKKDAIFFAYSEYQTTIVKLDEKTAEAKDPHELLDYFFPVIDDVIGTQDSTYIRGEATDVSWKDTTVSGLPAAKFTAKVETDKGTKGLTGICIIGEKRPYVFWALDLSEEQTYLDMAQEVLEACVKNFKEGS